MGLSTEFFGFGRCWNPPCVTRGVPACDRAPEPHPSGSPSPSLQMERGFGGEVGSRRAPLATGVFATHAPPPRRQSSRGPAPPSRPRATPARPPATPARPPRDPRATPRDPRATPARPPPRPPRDPARPRATPARPPRAPWAPPADPLPRPTSPPGPLSIWTMERGDRKAAEACRRRGRRLDASPRLRYPVPMTRISRGPRPIVHPRAHVHAGRARTSPCKIVKERARS